MCVCAARVVGVFVTTFDLFRILDCALLLSLGVEANALISPSLFSRFLWSRRRILRTHSCNQTPTFVFSFFLSSFLFT